jgi:hypothetical protein
MSAQPSPPGSDLVGGSDGIDRRQRGVVVAYEVRERVQKLIYDERDGVAATDLFARMSDVDPTVLQAAIQELVGGERLTTIDKTRRAGELRYRKPWPS